MKTITLNGGNFGGETFSVRDVDVKKPLFKIDADGGRWVYDYALNARTDTAEFVRYEAPRS